MNVTEANDVNTLLTFITGLTLFEHVADRDDDDSARDERDERLIRAAERLADRAHKAVGAGLTGTQAREGVMHVLDVDVYDEQGRLVANPLDEQRYRPIDDVVGGGQL